jgi:hypothetical protein
MDIDGNGPPTPRANPTLTTAADSGRRTLPPRGRALGSDSSPSSIPLEGTRASLRQRPKTSLIDPLLSIFDVRWIAARRQGDLRCCFDKRALLKRKVSIGLDTPNRNPAAITHLSGQLPFAIHVDACA